MSKKEKPLPKPPGTAFGRKKRFEHEEEQASLFADRMAAAAAEGKLEEFLEQEMPDSEHARSLARMMLGMTGMMPSGGERSSSQSLEKTEQHLSSESGAAEQTLSSGEMSEDVVKAVQGGDVKGLMALLRREHQKRMPGAAAGPGEEATAAQPADQPAIDKDVIDALIRIASDNGVTLDWIILRAIRVYVEEYRKTGKL
jgi:hypothetical protein